ncbi:MAG: hypothetical protein Q9213_002573 [Squamulea squamosa]
MNVFEYLYKLVSTAHVTSSSPFNPLSLLPGFCTLTPLTTIAQRTTQRGIFPLDPFVLAPGLHLQPQPTSSTKANSQLVPPLHQATCSTVFATQRVYALDDTWGLFFISNLILIRFINSVGDLFVLLSQDRWVRIRGAADDLKALTSGTWLSEPTTLDAFFGAVANLLVYANVAVAGHATDAGVYTIVSMLLVNSGLLALDNIRIRSLNIFGRTMEAIGEPKKYFRRRDLAEQLIKESGSNDWAVAMGLIVKDKASTEKNEGVVVTM